MYLKVFYNRKYFNDDTCLYLSYRLVSNQNSTTLNVKLFKVPVF